MKKRNSNRIHGCLGALLLLCALAGCQKKAEDVPPGLTGTPIPTQIEELSPTPAGAEEASPAPTKAEEVSPVPTEEGNPPQAGLMPPSEQEASLFATVTPVPQEMVSEIAGTMSKEDFPVVDGSTATIPLSQAVYQLATGEGKEEAETAIVHTKTTNSYYRLYDGEADLLIVYEPAEDIIERMKTEELLIKPIGLDALVFMKNKANPVESLTMEELVSIYSGQVKNWAEVGGADAELLAFQRPSGSGSQTLMQKLVMDGIPMEEGDNIFRFYTMSDILEGMLDYTGDDNTLGYSVFYYANFMYSFPELGFIGVNGVLPSSQTIYDGSYPLVNAFYAVIRPDEPEDSNARKIFDWLTGEEGQQMVMDLGYVPIIAPEGIKLPESAPAAEDTVQVLAEKPMEEGQHFIFLQMADMAFYSEYRYGRVIIYDHTWKPCAAFYNASVSTEGLCKDRYITIRQNRVQPGGGTESITRVYDLQENCFVELPGKRVDYVFDGQKGYVVCWKSIQRIDADGEEWEDYCGQLVDLEGNVLLDNIEEEDEYHYIRKEGNCYILERSPWGVAAKPDQKGWIYQVLGEDFQLKVEIFRELEDMPELADRLEGVYYTWMPTGCLMDQDGKILIDRAAVLNRFGTTGQEDVEMPDLDYLTLYEDGSKLYLISCDGEECYVDSTMRFCTVGTEQVGNWQDGEVPEDAFPYYWYYRDFKYYYLSPEGSPLCLSDGTEVSFAANRGREDYILAGKSENGIVIEEYIAGLFAGRYEYAVKMRNYDTIRYWSPNCFAVEETIPGTEDEEWRNNIYFYEKDTLLGCLSGSYVEQNYDWKIQGYENSWLARTDAGEFIVPSGLLLEGIEDTRISIYTYCLFADGSKFARDVSIAEFKEAGHLAYCLDGYLQVEGRNYIYVYDYNGDVVIKALNVAMAEQ